MLRVVRTLVLVTVLIGAPLGAAAQSPQEANKKIVVEFYDKAINQKDFERRPPSSWARATPSTTPTPPMAPRV